MKEFEIGLQLDHPNVCRRPADVASVRKIVDGGGKWLVAVNVALVVLALALSVVIGRMLYARHTADGGNAHVESDVQGNNKVIDSNDW